MDDGVIIPNFAAERAAPYGPEETAGYDPALAATARAALRRWRGYAPTPLYELPVLAARLGVARVSAKYEGARTELASFKALGGAYALSLALADIVRARGGGEASVEDLESGRFAPLLRGVVAVCASDGNHGRSLAWGANRFGCGCVIYLPATVSEGRARAIAKYGARVERVDGNYDEAVRRAAAAAEKNGWVLISDTASPTYIDPPRQVMAGYSLLADEAMEQIGSAPPSHVFAQVGCGGLAAVLAGYFWSRYGERRPHLIAVEPINAACLQETVARGGLAVVEGDHETMMGGLACGEVSFAAWRVLRRGLDFAMTVPERYAAAAVRALASGELGASMAACPSGAAGVAALLQLCEAPAARERLALSAASHVMLVITEGATDPEEYAALIA